MQIQFPDHTGRLSLHLGAAARWLSPAGGWAISGGTLAWACVLPCRRLVSGGRAHRDGTERECREHLDDVARETLRFPAMPETSARKDCCAAFSISRLPCRRFSGDDPRFPHLRSQTGTPIPSAFSLVVEASHSSCWAPLIPCCSRSRSGHWLQ